MDQYTNEMRATRMGAGDKVKSPAVSSSNDGESVKAADFKDAGDFLRGGGKVDGEMENIGSSSTIAKGSTSVGKPNLEKGAPGPQGPGVI